MYVVAKQLKCVGVYIYIHILGFAVCLWKGHRASIAHIAIIVIRRQLLLRNGLVEITNIVVVAVIEKVGLVARILPWLYLKRALLFF